MRASEFAAATPLNELGPFLNTLVGVVCVTVLGAIVAAIRKIKSGNIVDDDAVIARLDSDNVKLRALNDAKDEIIERERRARWHAEDVAAAYKRQLIDEHLIPVEVDRASEESNRDRT